MKTVKKIALSIVILGSVLFSSCSGDSGSSSSTFMKAKINGQEFSTQSVVANYTSDSFYIIGQKINGSDTSEIQISIDLTDGTDLEIGHVYNISTIEEDNYLAFMSYSFGDASSLNAYGSGDCDNVIGSLKITHVDDTIVEGTFEFDGKGVDAAFECNGVTKTIRDGSFRAPLAN